MSENEPKQRAITIEELEAIKSPFLSIFLSHDSDMGGITPSDTFMYHTAGERKYLFHVRPFLATAHPEQRDYLVPNGTIGYVVVDTTPRNLPECAVRIDTSVEVVQIRPEYIYYGWQRIDDQIVRIVSKNPVNTPRTTAYYFSPSTANGYDEICGLLKDGCSAIEQMLTGEQAVSMNPELI